MSLNGKDGSTPNCLLFWSEHPRFGAARVESGNSDIVTERCLDRLVDQASDHRGIGGPHFLATGVISSPSGSTIFTPEKTTIPPRNSIRL